MTEFELAYLTNEYGNSIAVMFGVYMSGMFAMVFASRYLANVQDRYMRGFVIFLYTLFTLVIVRGTLNSVQSFFSIRHIIRDGTWESPVLQFLAAQAPSDFAGVFAPYAILSVIGLAYVGSIVFFIRAGRSKESAT